MNLDFNFIKMADDFEYNGPTKFIPRLRGVIKRFKQLHPEQQSYEEYLEEINNPNTVLLQR